MGEATGTGVVQAPFAGILRKGFGEGLRGGRGGGRGRWSQFEPPSGRMNLHMGVLRNKQFTEWGGCPLVSGEDPTG